MTADQRLLKFIDDGDAIKSIEVLRAENSRDIVNVKLVFHASILFVGVNADDDTIVLSVKPPATSPGENWEAATSLLARAIGKRVRWCWRMQNNQGYGDGIQFEFCADPGDSDVLIQIIAIASKLALWELKPAN